jgi:hypothetical protein
MFWEFEGKAQGRSRSGHLAHRLDCVSWGVRCSDWCDRCGTNWSQAGRFAAAKKSRFESGRGLGFPFSAAAVGVAPEEEAKRRFAHGAVTGTGSRIPAECAARTAVNGRAHATSGTGWLNSVCASFQRVSASRRWQRKRAADPVYCSPTTAPNISKARNCNELRPQ